MRDCCPHCGGKDGIITAIRYRSTRITDWNGANEDVGPTMIVSEGNARCFNCKKPLRAEFKAIRSTTTKQKD